MSTFCLVTLFMVVNGASVVNQANSYETISPQGSVSGRARKSMEFTLGRTFWINKISISALRVKVGMALVLDNSGQRVQSWAGSCHLYPTSKTKTKQPNKQTNTKAVKLARCLCQ